MPFLQATVRIFHAYIELKVNEDNLQTIKTAQTMKGKERGSCLSHMQGEGDVDFTSLLPSGPRPLELSSGKEHKETKETDS